MSTKLKTHIENLLGNSDIVVNGTRPWDLKVHDERLYGRVLTHGTLGLGEAYMDGWWDAEQVDAFIHKLLLADFKAHFPVDIGLYGSALKGVLLNLQRSRVTEVGERHYDIGNDLYEAKLDLICRKAKLEKGMRILDIGSGWGGFLKFAAENYGVSGVGITISKEQAAYANAHRDGLPIETRLMDYQALDDKFDRIISIGMFEHVGYKNYRTYMEKARSLLKPDGLFVLHTIGGNYTTTHGDPWSEKYVFPNGMLPSAKQMTTASEALFVMEDWHNFGADYDRTLMAWHARFEAAWPALKHKYDERFYRMWRYYLLSFAATFRARKIQLWQIVYSPEGIAGGYRSPR
jgi:cyclopropane-fatty-acyl-phospholipid synthase